MKKWIALLAAALMMMASSLPAHAHSGRTDAMGGHYDHSTNQYHYHNREKAAAYAIEQNKMHAPYCVVGSEMAVPGVKNPSGAVSWQSADEFVALVDTYGIALAVSPGVTAIEALGEGGKTLAHHSFYVIAALEEDDFPITHSSPQPHITSAKILLHILGEFSGDIGSSFDDDTVDALNAAAKRRELPAKDGLSLSLYKKLREEMD